MNLPDLKKVSFPETVADALSLLAAGNGTAVPLSGGCSFIFAPYAGVEELVCLSRLPLSYIDGKSKGLRVGAATPVSRLVESKTVKSYAGGMLWEAARRIGSTLNRNLITIGGNLVQPFIWSDLPTVALALGAHFKIHGTRIRTLGAEKFFSRIPAQLLKKGELLTEIIFPPLPPGIRTSYHKFTLTETDFALLKVAILLSRRKQLCRDITMVVGGATVLPQRSVKAEAVLRGKKASQVLVNESSEVAAEELRVAGDIRCSTEYKRELCRVMVRGILEEIMLDHKVAKWKLL